MIKAIIFDLDGTILNTIYDLNNSINYALRQFNKEEITLDETKEFIGSGIKKLCERALKNNDLNILDDLYNEMINHYYKNYNLLTKKYDYIDEIINYIKSKNIIKGVLSNKKEEVLIKLVKEQFNDSFDFVIGDTGIRKPDPYNINKIANLYNLKNEEILYIGDSDIDIKTVFNAKCNGAYVSYGYRSYEDLKNSGASPILKTPLELFNYIKKCLL